MNAINTTTTLVHDFQVEEKALVTEPFTGAELIVGSGFNAQSFRARDIGEATDPNGDVMDPLVMVDHYTMTEPTFGAHPHAGMSAVSLLLEDSEGLFHNRDSLGNDFDLQPGDLYWLRAGSGAVHDESPRTNARIHGLQVFINVPQKQRFESPASLLVRSKDMPVINHSYFRVKVALGESNGVSGADSPSIPMTILDGTVQPGGRFIHESAPSRGVWVQSIKGSLDVVVGNTTRQLSVGQALAIKTKDLANIGIGNPMHEPVQFALFDGEQIAENYVQDGPFVMDSQEQIAQIKLAYKTGDFGNIPGND